MSSGEYVAVYTISYDMSAHIYTKGFDDAALLQRLLLLTSSYSPVQWKANVLRPAALLGDKSSAVGHPDSDEAMLNSQWPIFIMGGKDTVVKRKAIKQKPKKKAKAVLSMLAQYPNVRGRQGSTGPTQASLTIKFQPKEDYEPRFSRPLSSGEHGVFDRDSYG